MTLIDTSVPAHCYEGIADRKGWYPKAGKAEDVDDPVEMVERSYGF